MIDRSSKPSLARSERERRLGQALRENLRRRKAQARNKQAREPGGADAPGADAAPDGRPKAGQD